MAFGFIKNDRFNDYELAHKKASYKTVVDTFIGDIVICNNLPQIDDSVWDNMQFAYYDEYDNPKEIFQWYLCNIDDYERERAIDCGLLITYSELLDCDVLCVDHYGTGWGYVLTDNPIFDTWEEWEDWFDKGV